MESKENNCEVLTDFTDGKTSELWRTVNDNVMGGKSKGGFSVENDVLIFSGDINTNGGGFSSIRMALKDESLEGFDIIKMRLRTKDKKREYRIIMEDKNRKSITYRSPIPTENTEEWQEVSMALADFIPSRRGEPRETPVFEKSAPESIGFMLNDTFDGNFEIEIDWIKLCK